MKTLIKTYRLTVLVLSLLILNQVAYAQLCDITPNKFKGCRGDLFDFSIISPTSSYYSIMWNFGDNDSSNQKTSNIQHTYDTFGCFTVTVTLYADAIGTIKCGPSTITVCVYDLPQADFILPVPSTMCFKGNKFQFIDSSIAGKSNTPIATRSWDFGDGGKSSATNPLYSYLQSGAYTIFLQITDTNGCYDTVQRIASIIVLPDLAPKFKTTYKINCPTTPVKFDNLSDSNGKCIATWWWDYGDGTGDSSATNWNSQFIHTYHQDGAFNPKLYLKSCYGCVDSFIFPAGARNIFYWFDIKKSAPGPICWEGNNVCFQQKPRPNAYYWLWTFDDPPSQQLNTDDKTWVPCHKYTAPGFYHITLKIWEPNCIRDTTFCSFIPLKGPMAMIKLPPPAPNSKCGAYRKIPISYFEAMSTSCWNPTGNPVVYTYSKNVAKFIDHTDSFYCNATVVKIDSVLKPGCDDTIVTKVNYRLGYAQGGVDYWDSLAWYSGSWYPGDPYPWTAPFNPVPLNKIYFQPGGCNLKNIHDSDQYKFDCRGPNLVFFPNNTVKYRLRYDIDNNAPGFSIPPGKDMSMDRCKNPSYPWGSDSLQYFWDFTDSYGDDCTSTVAKPNVKCKYSTEVAPLHLYKENGCYSPKLMVTDTVTGCISQANVTIPMEPPDAGWSYKVFKGMAASGWDTMARKLDWNLQLQMPPAWGRRGMILNGTPCVGQAYPQRPSFTETLPRCDRQKWWMVFDSAAQCSGYCKETKWIDTNGDGTNDKYIKTVAIQCGWIDDQTFAMMGNKWIYSKGGCKTVGLIIKTGDCFDTFWYNQYKYIADLQAVFDVLDPASYNVDSFRYLKTLDYAGFQQLKLCPPFQTILTVTDTTQTGITNFNYSIGKNFAAPWTKPWNGPMEDSCILIQSVSYMLCHKDSFFVSPLPPKDTTWTYCFMFPNPSLNCGVNQLGKVSVDTFIKMGYLRKDTFNLLDLRDTLFMNDTMGNSLFEPGKYAITSIVRNIYGCVNLAQRELLVGHYTDFEASDQIICYEGGGDTVNFSGFIRYFRVKQFPWELDYDTTQFWRWPMISGTRAGNGPAAPSIPEVVEWDLNGDGVYGDGATGIPDSVFWVYNQPGNYTIRMKTIDSNNCTQILEKKDFIQVIGVVADFDTANGVSACAPQFVQFVDKSYGLNIYQYVYDRFGNKIDSTAVDTVVYWKWDFGDNLGGNRSTSFLKNPIHTYRNNGTFNVSLVVRMGNGCIDSITKFNYIYIQGPIPNFVILDSIGCKPFKVYVKDRSDSSTIKTWEFIKGDNTIGSFTSRNADSIFELDYKTAGTFKLYLRASDSVFNSAIGKWITCTSEYAEVSDSFDPHFTIIVKPVRPSAFNGDTLICSGSDALFNDLSAPAYDTISWRWDDGSNLELKGRGNATHKYTLPAGVYDKTFSVEMNAIGPDSICPDDIKYWNIRVVDAKAGIAAPLVDLPKYQFADRSTGGTHRKITITGIDNPNYFVEYNSSDYKNDSLVDHNFMNDTGSFNVCEITWIERNGLVGCPDTSCMIVKNEFVTEIEVPNIFTPGEQDLKNDLFYIKTQGVEKWDITIMNRWGEKVFKSTDPKDYWNGKRMNKGTDCAAGVYYYIINFQLRGKSEDSKAGSITLIR